MPLRVLTWHVHGNYLFYLAHVPVEFYLPVKAGRPEGYGGRAGGFAWPDNVHEVDAADVADLEIDLVLSQSRRNWETDRYEILSPAQLRLPRVYLEHDPPREHPTDTKHVVDDPDVLLVHVTHFNELMWDSGRTPTTVIEHGVTVPEDVRYTGDFDRGISVVNGMDWRGRRLGADVFDTARQSVPLELVGMGSEKLGGLGEVPHQLLPALESQYRFFFNPIRYTSLGLSLCEAMMLGIPVVALATCEYATVVRDGENGYASTDLARLIDRMRFLVDDRAEALRLGRAARDTALDRFRIDRFVRDWQAVLTGVAGRTGRVAVPV
ncbi:MAG TPA: glycosyltransferase family 4 protein [Coriobacteriia bacterium]|jgi:glycosyltransferase involved in cell wall biosynthesis